MKKVVSPAIRTHSGKVYQAAKQADHDALEAKGIKGTRGFILSNGAFADRTEAAAVAKKAGQVPEGIQSLHSDHLRDYRKKKEKTGSI
jgi:choline dehydrogenase-like flavoprotein